MAELACNLGLRICEVLGPKWGDFDSESKTLSICQSAVDGTVADVRCKASRDVLPLNANFIVVLMRWKRLAPAPEEGWMFPSVVTERPYHAGIQRIWKGDDGYPPGNPHQTSRVHSRTVEWGSERAGH